MDASLPSYLHATHVQLAGQAYFITNLESRLFNDFVGQVLEGLGYERPKRKVPSWLLYAAASCAESVVSSLVRMGATNIPLDLLVRVAGVAAGSAPPSLGQAMTLACPFMRKSLWACLCTLTCHPSFTRPPAGADPRTHPLLVHRFLRVRRKGHAGLQLQPGVFC